MTDRPRITMRPVVHGNAIEDAFEETLDAQAPVGGRPVEDDQPEIVGDEPAAAPEPEE